MSNINTINNLLENQGQISKLFYHVTLAAAKQGLTHKNKPPSESTEIWILQSKYLRY